MNERVLTLLKAALASLQDAQIKAEKTTTHYESEELRLLCGVMKDLLTVQIRVQNQLEVVE